MNCHPGIRSHLAAAVGAGMLLACGCGCDCGNGQACAPLPATNAAPAKASAAQTMIDGFTGKTALQAGKKARETLESVNADREKDMRELEAF
jgi:hypothetical protein